MSKSIVEAAVWRLAVRAHQRADDEYQYDDVAGSMGVRRETVEAAANHLAALNGVEAPSVAAQENRIKITGSFPPHYGNRIIDSFPAALEESRWDIVTYRIANHMNEFAFRPFTRRDLELIAGYPASDDLDKAVSHLKQIGAISEGDDELFRWANEDVDRFRGGRHSVSLSWQERLHETMPQIDSIEEQETEIRG